VVLARPIARPLLVSLLLAALVLFAAISVSRALAPSLNAVTLAHQNQSQMYSAAKGGNAPVQAAPAPAKASSGETVQRATPQGPAHPIAGGVQRFADGGPGIPGRAPQPALSCNAKLCPRPQM